MRTTVTLDRDVEQLVKEVMHRSRRSFKEVLNAGLRKGLRREGATPDLVPFKIKARSLGLRAGFDPAGFNKMADELEVDEFLSKARKATSK